MHAENKHLFIFLKKERHLTEAKRYGNCAECGEELREGTAAFLLGDSLYCPACVRGARIELGIYSVIPPRESRKNVQTAEKSREKRLYFKERRDRI